MCWSCFCGSLSRAVSRQRRTFRDGALLMRPFGSRGPDASLREGRTASFAGRLYPIAAPPGRHPFTVRFRLTDRNILCGSGRSQRGRKRAPRRCRPTPGMAPARAVLRTAGGSSQTKLSLKDTAARLFREAPQWKTVAAVAHAEGIEVLRAEMQKYAAGAAKGGRVVEPVAANVAQSTRSCIAVARGEPTGHFIGSLYPNRPDSTPITRPLRPKRPRRPQPAQTQPTLPPPTETA